MKKITATIVSLLLSLVIITGCSSQASTSTPAPTPTPTLLKATVDPTAAIDTTLTGNTIYDESAFSITIPKGTRFIKASNVYSWTLLNDKYIVQVQIATSDNTAVKVSTLTENETALNALVSSLQSASSDEIKMDSGYKKLTVSGKNALLLSGKVTTDEATGTIEVYYIDSSAGLLFMTVAKMQNGTDATAQTEMNATATNIYNSITIK